MSELRGVFAPIVTPFRPTDGEVDLPWIPGYIAYRYPQTRPQTTNHMSLREWRRVMANPDVVIVRYGEAQATVQAQTAVPGHPGTNLTPVDRDRIFPLGELPGLMGTLAAPGAPVRRRVVHHTAECGAHPHCEGECRVQPREPEPDQEPK